MSSSISIEQEMGEEWILLDFWPSMFGSRVRIAMAEKGISFEYREEDLPNMCKSSLLLEMNPVHKKIPVLIHNGKPICESLNIVEYIDEFCVNAPILLPSDPYEKARARFWANFIDNKLHAAGLKTTWYKSKEELEEGKKELIECMKKLEEALGDKPYFGGETLGYVDVVVGGYCSWFFVYEASGNISIEAECPKLMEWTKRCMKRESFSKSLKEPHKIYEFVVQMRNKLGLNN